MLTELEETKAKQQRLKAYLAEGLDGECWRADDGLPGYLRDQ